MDNKIKPKMETFEAALAEYSKKQKVELTRCERCNQFIEIKKLGESALSVKCECGLYNDTLRGL